MLENIFKYSKSFLLYLIIIIIIILVLVAIFQYSENNMYYNKIIKINGIIIESKNKKLNNMGITNLDTKNNIYSSMNIQFNYNNQLLSKTINDIFDKQYNCNDKILLYYDVNNDKLYKNDPRIIKYLLLLFIILSILLCVFLIFYYNKNNIYNNIIKNDDVFNLIEKSLNNNLNEVKKD